ncbi:MAG: hypothetical protein DMF86_09685 [Acidobacteria bacterium]|nr:MAG: hypothetical protein DMF86_09685 [Acidobacteriota bacterium]
MKASRSNSAISNQHFRVTSADAGVARTFEYTLLNGQAGASPFWQMLQHVVNHGSYHRGQITTMLRQLGAAPPKSVRSLVPSPSSWVLRPVSLVLCPLVLRRTRDKGRGTRDPRPGTRDQGRGTRD